MSTRTLALLSAVVVAVATAVPAHAGVAVQVTATGEVEFNQINVGPLAAVNAGDLATMTFDLDSDLYLDSLVFPTRGYEIDQPSFSLALGSTTVGLQNPFPAGETPYLVLRNNDPAVDGFFLDTNVDTGSPDGLPLDQAGSSGQFMDNYVVTYTGATLSSLDILDALGTYDFTGLTTFTWQLGDGPVEAMLIIFRDMTITATDVVVPEPASLGLLGLALLAVRRKRS